MQRITGRSFASLGIFSRSVADQAVLSASSFIVGLLLVRLTSEAQYGYFVLISVAILLAKTLQGSFISPPMVISMTGADESECANLIGSLNRDHRYLLPWLVAGAIVLALIAQLRGALDPSLALTLAAGTVAVIATLRREFFRGVLIAYRRPHEILKADAIYCIVLVAGVYAATFSPYAAALAALAIAIASFIGTSDLSRALWSYKPWNRDARRGKLRELAPLGGWSAFGGGIHWLFSQGYNYLVAGLLDIHAVAALAAMRLLVMPVNLLSTGIATMMFPTVSHWLQHVAPLRVFRRLALFSGGLAALACCYLLVVWLVRQWILADILDKRFEHADSLLFLWSVIAVVMIVRDQLLHFLTARGRFRVTSSLTLVSAVAGISGMIEGIRYLGDIGVLLGLLAGETINVLGLLVMSVRDARQPVVSVEAAPSGQ